MDVLRNDLAILAKGLRDLTGTVLQMDVVLDLLYRKSITLLYRSSSNSAGQGKSRCEVSEGRHVR